MGNYRGAIESYRRAIALAPRDDPRYYYLPYNLGALYQGLNRLREAEGEYRKAITPGHGEPENAIGTIRAIQGKRAEALRWFEMALQKDSSLEIARRNRNALK